MQELRITPNSYEEALKQIFIEAADRKSSGEAGQKLLMAYRNGNLSITNRLIYDTILADSSILTFFNSTSDLEKGVTNIAKAQLPQGHFAALYGIQLKVTAPTENLTIAQVADKAFTRPKTIPQLHNAEIEAYVNAKRDKVFDEFPVDATFKEADEQGVEDLYKLVNPVLIEPATPMDFEIRMVKPAANPFGIRVIYHTIYAELK